MIRAGAILLPLVSCALAFSAGASAHQGADRAPERAADAQEAEEGRETGTPSTVSVPDVLVLNQDGKPIRFYSDLVQGRVVAVNFIYTTCTTTCPILGVTFAKVQDLLGARLGKEVSLLSISVDPATDTPERLKAWGAKFQARPGWTLVTGTKPAIATLLRALGASGAWKEDHPPLVLIGNASTGRWTRAYGLAPPTQLTALIEAVRDRSGRASPKAVSDP